MLFFWQFPEDSPSKEIGQRLKKIGIVSEKQPPVPEGMGWRLASFSETIWSPIRPKCQNSIHIQNEALSVKMKLLKRSWVNLEHFKHKEHVNSRRSKKKKYFQTPGFCEISSEYNGFSNDHWDHHSVISVMLYCDCAAKYSYHLDFTHLHQPSWRRKWQTVQVFLPGESRGQRSLVGYSPWGCKELDTTEWLTHTHTHTHIHNGLSYRHLTYWLTNPGATGNRLWSPYEPPKYWSKTNRPPGISPAKWIYSGSAENCSLGPTAMASHVQSTT